LNDHVRVGVGVIIEEYGKVLLMKRKGSIGSNTWGLPGGKLEKFETIENCAFREVKEETNLDISDIIIDSTITNDIFHNDNIHYITLYVKCEHSGDLKNLEKNKCSIIKWFDWKELPTPLFGPFKNYLKNKKIK